MSGIIRVKKEEKYFVASNELFNDKALSWEARGVMGYLLSKPDNWTVRTRDLVRQSPAGMHKVTRILSELKKAGYIRRERRRLDNGRFEWETVVYESSTIPRLSSNGLSIDGLPVDGSSVNGESPHIVNTDSPTTDLPNTNGTKSPKRERHTPTLATSSQPSAVDIFLSVTRIKKLDKIPEKVTDWLQEQESYMGAGYHPEALRAAIKAADKEGKESLFDPDRLDQLFADYVPKVVNASYTNGKKGKFTINWIELSNGEKLTPDKTPGWVVDEASKMIKADIERKEQASNGNSQPI